MRLTKTVRRLRYALSPNSLRFFNKLLRDPILSQTYYPEEERKSKPVIWLENFLWCLRHGELNKYYYFYGMDRKNGLGGLEIMPYKDFKKMRDARNDGAGGQRYTYSCVMGDKFLFGQLVTSLGFPTPRNHALLTPSGLTWLGENRQAPLEDLLADPTREINGFCKELTGGGGKGAFPLQVSGGRLYSRGQEITVEELRSRVKGTFLLQQILSQHADMARLHPSSLNTLRIHTIRGPGQAVDVLCVTVRIGTGGRSLDNYSLGGIILAMDMETGLITGHGLYKAGFGGSVRIHPDTGIPLEGYAIPYFKEAMDLVRRLHSHLYGFHSIGWDVGITPDGPVVIEGNDTWEGGLPMGLEKNFKSRFLKYFEDK